MSSQTSGTSPDLLTRLLSAANHRDLPALVACFDADYVSEQPVHPDRAFRGRAQVEQNWAAMFAGLPDFHIDVLRSVRSDDELWVEWRWTGTRADRSRLDAAGACVFGVRDDRLAWGRLYMEEVGAGEGIKSAVSSLSGRSPSDPTAER